MPDKTLDESLVALKAARDIVDEADAKGRDLTAEERVQIDAATADHAAATVKHADELRVKNVKDRLSSMEEPSDRPRTKVSDADPDEDYFATKEYKRSFKNYMKTGQIDEVLRKTGAFAEANTSTLYGATVPRDFQNEFAQTLFNFAPVLGQGLVDVLEASSNIVELPQLTAHGVSSTTWVAEAATVTQSTDPTTARLVITVGKYAGGALVSNELVDDSAFNLDTYLAQELGGQLAVQVNSDLTVGTGTNHTWGFMSTHATKVFTTAATNAFTADELFGVRDAIIAPYWRNASWHVNQAVYRSLGILKDSQNRYLMGDLSNFGGLSNGSGYQLLGNPLVINPDVVGTTSLTTGQKFIAFADLHRGFAVVRRPTVGLARSTDYAFGTDQVAYRLTMRYGADVKDASAIAIGKTA